MGASLVSYASEPYYVGAGLGLARMSSIGKTGYKVTGDVHAGYILNENIALEAGYHMFSNHNGFSSNNAIAGSVLVGMPLYGSLSDFAAYARLGVDSLKSKYAGSSNRSTNFMWGLGVEGNITKQVSARVEYTDFGSTEPSGKKIHMRRLNLLDINYRF